jgi:Uncharacterised BCR, YnfA/UPF0060 family
VSVLKTLALFVVAAIAEIGGAWLVWQGVREHRRWIWVGAGIAALAAYGFVATLQDDANFGRILAGRRLRVAGDDRDLVDEACPVHISAAINSFKVVWRCTSGGSMRP